MREGEWKGKEGKGKERRRGNGMERNGKEGRGKGREREGGREGGRGSGKRESYSQPQSLKVNEVDLSKKKYFGEDCRFRAHGSPEITIHGQTGKYRNSDQMENKIQFLIGGKTVMKLESHFKLGSVGYGSRFT